MERITISKEEVLKNKIEMQEALKHEIKMFDNVTKFEKVSQFQFKLDATDLYPLRNVYKKQELDLKNINPIGIAAEQINQAYDNLKMPKRGSTYSAGYDIYAPYDFILKPGESIVIPTGLKCKINNNWFLAIVPRSGQGFRYGLRLSNTVGIIDGDYYNNPSNEGHIFIKLKLDVNAGETLDISQGQAFCQGIFLPYGLTIDDNIDTERNGGLGSTDK